MNRQKSRSPANVEREIAAVEEKYPHLHCSQVGDRRRLVGTIGIFDDDVELDRFSIIIELPADYPESLPVVREVGGRIPHVLARHVIPSTGDACVLLPDQRWELWPDGSTLLDFFDGPVHNYFLGQALVERGEPWPFGEWAHGLQGVLDYYNDLLGTDRLEMIRKYLDYLGAKKIKGHWDCPCLSGKRLRNCHLAMVSDLRERLPRREAIRSLRRLTGMAKLLNSTISPVRRASAGHTPPVPAHPALGPS